MLDLKSVHYFAYIAKVGSITSAAVDLHIARPALTRHIQRIEESAGVQLLVRMPRGVRLTRAGQLFLEHCHSIMRQVELAEVALHEQSKLPRGDVVLGIRPTTARLLTPGIIKKIRNQLPGISLTVVEACSHTLYGHLLAGYVDVAFLTTHVVVPSHKQHVLTLPLVTELLHVVSAPQPHRIKPSYDLAELAHTEMVTNIGTSDLLYQQFRSHGKFLNVKLELDSMEAIRNLLIRGSAVTLCPISTFREDLQANRVAAFPISDVNLRWTGGLAYLADGIAPAAQAVARAVRSEIEHLTSQGIFGDDFGRPKMVASTA
jgi:LysR family nitrogen assimilation transcriptional regulator